MLEFEKEQNDLEDDEYCYLTVSDKAKLDSLKAYVEQIIESDIVKPRLNNSYPNLSNAELALREQIEDRLEEQANAYFDEKYRPFISPNLKDLNLNERLNLRNFCYRLGFFKSDINHIDEETRGPYSELVSVIKSGLTDDEKYHIKVMTDEELEKTISKSKWYGFKITALAVTLFVIGCHLYGMYRDYRNDLAFKDGYQQTVNAINRLPKAHAIKR